MWQNLTEFERGMLAALQCPEPAAPVRVEKGGEGIELRRTPEGWQLRLAKEAMLGRATVLLEEDRDRPAGWVRRERPAYPRLGALVDGSRNAVPTPASLTSLTLMAARRLEHLRS